MQSDRGDRYSWILLLIVPVVGLLLSCRPGTDFRVVRVIDGDTVVIDNQERIRYIGIDTPELARGGRPAEPMAEDAREFNRKLVEGRRIRLEFDRQRRDRFGRVLAYVYVDPIMVNEELVESGLARAVAYPPTLRYRERLERLEEEAKSEKKGIWGLRKGSP